MKYDDTEILLVEDNENEADLTLRAIMRSNLTEDVHWVKDGEEAINFLFGKGAYQGRNTTKQPKIVLLDLNMPKVSGLEVLEKIKSDPRTLNIHVIVLTSSNSDGDIFNSIKSGVDKYLTKPLDFNEFVLQLQSELGYCWKMF